MSLSFTLPQWQRRLVKAPDDVRAQDDTLTLRSDENTDWWRTSADSEPEADVDRHSGPLYVFEVADSTTKWTASVWIAVDHRERFQQATLFVGQGDFEQGRQPWLKAGVEIEDDRQNIGSVVAAPISDWTLFPVAKDTPVGLQAGSWLYIEAKRTKGDVILSYCLGKPGDELEHKHLMREVKGFARHLNEPWHIGVMTCGPKSKETVSTFHNFRFSNDDA